MDWIREKRSGGENRSDDKGYSDLSRNGEDMGLLVDSITDSDDGSLRREVQVFSMPNKRMLFAFPERLERFLAPFDDAIIKFCQIPKGKIANLISLFITLLVTIEVCIPMPFILFILGYDGLGTLFTYLAILTCLISQVPKRFIWRFRPYMVNRADRRRKDLTSSFPSRAVTCAVVYAFAFCWAYVYRMDKGVFIEWWMPILCLGLPLLASYARINLGVHYPSDCVAGAFQGVIICGLAHALWAANVLGCSTCRDLDCYSVGDHRILWNTLDRASWLAFGILVACMAALVIISVIKPIEFWVKCDRVYGTLLPCVVFQVVFLCPASYNNDCSLPEPQKNDWYSYLYGIGLAGLLTVIPLITKGKWPVVAWGFLFTCSFSAILWWRLFITS